MQERAERRARRCAFACVLLAIAGCVVVVLTGRGAPDTTMVPAAHEAGLGASPAPLAGTSAAGAGAALDATRETVAVPAATTATNARDAEPPAAPTSTLRVEQLLM